MLHETGVSRGDRVGIYLHKSIETATAVYGIMKAGAAYVPIDPLAPPARLSAVIEDASIRHLVTHDLKKADVARLLDSGASLRAVVGLSSSDIPVASLSWEDVLSASTARRPSLVKQTDMAYMMYTSGTTGEPKGIVHTHASGLSYALFAAKTYELNEHDRLSGFPLLHFDQSTFDYFSGPSAGATTVIIPEAYMRLPASLSKLIQDERLTVWYSVPLALVQLLNGGVLEDRDLSHLRWVLFGGEPLPVGHLRRLMQLLPRARFSNVYGPAEVNQVTIFNLASPSSLEDEVPLGSVWGNADGMVVDEHGDPVPQGEIGELVVSTPAIMQGYWNRPDLTRQALLRRSSASGRVKIFYRTGDLVRQAADDTLYFVGRRDRQVKVRGHRIELDALETAIQGANAVDRAAVYMVQSDAGDSTVFAAVTPIPNVDLDTAEIYRHLSDRIPKYALPEVIHVVSELPLTTTGKIDHKALQKAHSAFEGQM